MSEAITPFKVEIQDAQIEDLRRARRDGDDAEGGRRGAVARGPLLFRSAHRSAPSYEPYASRRAARVEVSGTPDGTSPRSFWKDRTAARVSGPRRPSTPPW